MYKCKNTTLENAPNKEWPSKTCTQVITIAALRQAVYDSLPVPPAFGAPVGVTPF